MQKYKINIKILCRQDGSMMVVTLLIMAILSVSGVYAINISSTELQATSNYQTQKMAFYDADAGVQFTIAFIQNDLVANGGTSVYLPATSNTADDVDIENATDYPDFSNNKPSGFSFVISPVQMINSNEYAFFSTGSDSRGARVRINVRFNRDQTNSINFAAFGDKKVDTKNGGTTLSYDSSSTDPAKNDPFDASFQSTHEADIGSNDWLVTHNGADIDGDGVFGEKEDGSATTDNIHGGTTFYGTAGVNFGERIDPDPLGVNSPGGEYNPATYGAINDNGDPPLNGATTLNTNSSITLEGKSGGANYYFTSITLKNGADLNIDASNGPVNIFLEGGFDAKNGSTINVIDASGNPGKPTDFAIFSNSSQKIDFKHSSEFRGMVYAPFADIDMKNSSAVYGAIWGKTVDIKNSGTLYYDTALKDKYTSISNDLYISSWQEDLN